MLPLESSSSPKQARRGRARTPTPGRYQGVKVEIGGPRGYGGGGYGGGYGEQISHI